ncbi:hypothetical protein M5689_002867 [Euphorbia peplus]|nr:hypothetical protein M5689_002867 [Euphorbia peplus]
MVELYIDEEDAWKCPKHPSRRRRTGICHHCLRDRLSLLCPYCAHERPCSCCTSSSSSSSSSFSRFPTTAADSDTGATDRVSNLIDKEPAFRRSRSLAIPFFRSKPAADHDSSVRTAAAAAPSFLSRIRSIRGNFNRSSAEENNNEEERRRMMKKSRSVAVTSDSGEVKSSSKGKGWYFPSPIKAFKQSISRSTVQEKSPVCRG